MRTLDLDYDFTPVERRRRKRKATPAAQVPSSIHEVGSGTAAETSKLKVVAGLVPKPIVKSSAAPLKVPAQPEPTPISYPRTLAFGPTTFETSPSPSVTVPAESQSPKGR